MAAKRMKRHLALQRRMWQRTPLPKPRERDRWSKFRDVATGLAAIAIPIVVAVIGNAISVSLKDRDIKLRTVELAISILQENPKANPESPVLRTWAMTVIDAYSGIPLPEGAKKELQQRPIVTGSERANFTCETTGGSVDLIISRRVPVVVFSDRKKDSCTFSIAGGTAVSPSTSITSVRCPSIDAVAYWPEGFGAASAAEAGGKCVIEFAASNPAFEGWFSGVWPFSVPKTR